MTYKVTPLSPLPLTSPGRSAGVGGECMGQKAPVSPFSHLATPPQHSQSWTLCGPEIQPVMGRGPTLVLFVPLHVPQTFTELEAVLLDLV